MVKFGTCVCLAGSRLLSWLCAGISLLSSVNPEWSDQYIEYNQLKREIRILHEQYLALKEQGKAGEFTQRMFFARCLLGL